MHTIKYINMNQTNTTPLSCKADGREPHQQASQRDASSSLQAHLSAPTVEKFDRSQANTTSDKNADVEPLSNLQLTKKLKELDEKVLDDYIWQENHTLNKVAFLKIDVYEAIEGLKKENVALKEQNSMIVTAFNFLQAKLQKILRVKDNELRPLPIEPSMKQDEKPQKPSQKCEAILGQKKRSSSSSSDSNSPHSRSRQKRQRIPSRVKELSQQQKKETVEKIFNQKMSVREAASKYGRSKATIYKWMFKLYRYQ